MAGIRKGLIKQAVSPLLVAGILFASAGRLDWAMAWAYVAVMAAAVAGDLVIIMRNHPELLAERSQVKDNTKDWDRVLARLMALVGPVAMWTAAGVGFRLARSSSIPPALQIVSLAVVAASSLLVTWAMAANKFFSGVVRIQKDRGHTVVTGGPYRFVRHPGYLGTILFALATPPALGSLWGFLPGAFTAFLAVFRTALEDRVLQEELDGYKDYARQVPYRLVPRVW